ncbi:MAG: hypothetical protein CM15mP23_23240 [Cryomorphaceae bacterium]|nr:MAG: hypothetical protein CM15mP23_23240 [Cryomorphaceae bacterium]
MIDFLNFTLTRSPDGEINSTLSFLPNFNSELLEESAVEILHLEFHFYHSWLLRHVEVGYFFEEDFVVLVLGHYLSMEYSLNNCSSQTNHQLLKKVI